MSDRTNTQTTQKLDELPPHSIDAEACLMASMMLEQSIVPQVLAVMRKRSFVLPDHQIIFDVLAQLFLSGRPADAVILREELKKRKLLDDVGGVAYIARLINAVPSSAHRQKARTVSRSWFCVVHHRVPVATIG